jgi:hypothetical protein
MGRLIGMGKRSPNAPHRRDGRARADLRTELCGSQPAAGIYGAIHSGIQRTATGINEGKWRPDWPPELGKMTGQKRAFCLSPL